MASGGRTLVDSIIRDPKEEVMPSLQPGPRTIALVVSFIVGLSALLISEPVSAQSLKLFGRGDAVQAQSASHPEFGTASESILLIGEDAFQLVSDTEGPFAETLASRTCSGTDCIFIATPTLPSGALLTGLELEACDTDATNQFAFALFQFSEPVQPGTVASTIFQSGAAATPGCGLYSIPLSRTVSNSAEKLLIDVNVGPGDVSFSSVRLHYMLQVSPAPGTATFGDVPTDHPFFQFVEALAASGITAGCGNGNYCPDTPLTRGQMAVFLSKALGLHFPN
jgi:hypothetical protein